MPTPAAPEPPNPPQRPISNWATTPTPVAIAGAAPRASRARSKTLFAGMRIRKKLLLLHTLFCLILTAVLLVAIRIPVAQIIAEAESGDSASVRAAADRVFLFLILSMLGIYALIVVALELFVLPLHVYAPIRLMLRADDAVQRRDHARELIPAELIPADELGEIMTSRNASVRALRRQEAALADALDRLEAVAADLKRKNHLLENARRTLEDADRLASLGMMSAGIAHELNTPLAVARGMVERLRRRGNSLEEPDAALLERVVGRLERLGESLLDFARLRPPRSTTAPLAPIVDEALTLVRIDRNPADIQIHSQIGQGLALPCDPERLVQVLVNIVRNAIDAVRAAPASLSPRPGRIDITAELEPRDGHPWLSIRVADDGPGIDPAILPRLFEPFASSRLDAKGTGLGLAVAEGIIRQHMGALIARNRDDARGAVFEILLPAANGAATSPNN